MKLRTLIARVNPPARQLARRLYPVEALVLHWTSLASYERLRNEHPIPNAELDAGKLSDAFVRGTMAPYTNGLFPYTAIVLEDATVEQCLPLVTVGAHCPNWNSRSLSLAYIGEPNLPTNAQAEAVVRVFADWLIWLGRDVRIAGHTELSPKPGGYPCPHPRLGVSALGDAARARMPGMWTMWDQAARDSLTICNGWQIEVVQPVAAGAA